MDGKVLLYDYNDVKIGETYVRRARQLVKQQRAAWVDDSQKAIRFAPGMENMEDSTDMYEAHETHHAHEDINAFTDKQLMKLAKRRVHAKFAFRLHRSIAVMLSVFFVLIFLITGRGYFWPVWPILSLALSVGIHWAVYKIITGVNMNEKITREYEMLKVQHSWAGDGRKG